MLDRTLGMPCLGIALGCRQPLYDLDAGAALIQSPDYRLV